MLNAARRMMVWRIVVVLNLLTPTVGGVVLFFQYHQQPQHKNAARMCWLAVIVMLTALLWTAGTALFLPLQALLRDLS